jgi:hypothetical protein
MFVTAILLAIVSMMLAIKASSIKHHRAIAVRRLEAIAERADQQNNWILDGDLRGFYGDYPVVDLWPNKTMTEVGAAVEASSRPVEAKIDWEAGKPSGDGPPGIYETMKTQLDEIQRKGEAERTAARIKEQDELSLLPAPLEAADFGGPANSLLTINERRQRWLAEEARLNGIASASHPAGTVIEMWGGGIVKVLHDKYDYSCTLSVMEAQQQLDEAKHQIEWAARRMGLEPVAGRTDPVTGRTETYYQTSAPLTAYQVNAVNAMINAAKPAQVLHATPPRKPAKRKELPALAEGGCVDELLKEAKEAHGA